MDINHLNKQQLPPASGFVFGEGTFIMAHKKISGLVTNIVDGNTFEMKVQNESDASSNNGQHTELIRIQGRNKPEASTLSGILTKLELEKMIVGHKVECEIIQRDETDQLVAVIPKKYLQSPFSFDPKAE